MSKSLALTDIPTLRKRARQHIHGGSVTAGYSANREKVLELLNASLATEFVCVLRYRRHHFMAKGIHSQSVAQEFLDHSNEELGARRRFGRPSGGLSRCVRGEGAIHQVEVSAPASSTPKCVHRSRDLLARHESGRHFRS
jgi:hypothetical protein